MRGEKRAAREAARAEAAAARAAAKGPVHAKPPAGEGETPALQLPSRLPRPRSARHKPNIGPL